MTQEQFEKVADLGQKIANMQEAKKWIPEIAKAGLERPKYLEEYLDKVREKDNRAYHYIVNNADKYLEKLCEKAMEHVNAEIEDCIEGIKHIEDPEQNEEIG